MSPGSPSPCADSITPPTRAVRRKSVTLTAVTDANGNYIFEGLEMPESRIYIADVVYQGVTYSSDLAIVTAGVTEMVIPPSSCTKPPPIFPRLSFSQVHFFVDIADGIAQVIGVYTFSNTSEKTIVVQSAMDVPFLKMPADAENVGFDLTQDSAPLLQQREALPSSPVKHPMESWLSILLPYDNKAQIVQPFVLPASSVLVLVPNGVKVKSDQLTEGGSAKLPGDGLPPVQRWPAQKR